VGIECTRLVGRRRVEHTGQLLGRDSLLISARPLRACSMTNIFTNI
jgi:hypothetical protein